MEQFKATINKVLERLKKNENVVGVILFGSLASNSAHKNSDIDLYVIGGNERDRVTYFKEDGIDVQIQWRSVEDFEKKVLKPTRKIPISFYGKILYDPLCIIVKNFNLAKTDILGPKKLSDDAIYAIQIALSQDLHTISGLIENNQESSAKILIYDLLFQAIDAYYDYHKWWLPSKKKILGDLKGKDEALFNICEHVILAHDVHEQVSYLKKVKEIVLPLIGGEVSEYEIVFDE